MDTMPLRNTLYKSENHVGRSVIIEMLNIDVKQKKITDGVVKNGNYGQQRSRAKNKRENIV